MNEIRAAGGLIAPFSDAYALHGSNERPVRDAFVEMMRISQMSNIDRHIYKLGKGMSVAWGNPDITARVAETDWESDWCEPDEIDGHEWDVPIKLAWSGMYEFRMRYSR